MLGGDCWDDGWHSIGVIDGANTHCKVDGVTHELRKLPAAHREDHTFSK